MRQAKVRGLPVHGSKYLHGTAPVAGNPGGYYDLLDEEVVNLRAGVAKVWPRQMRNLRVIPDKLIVCGRADLDEWIESIDKQIKREGGDVKAEEVLEFTMPLMQRMLDNFPGEVLHVVTETLDDQLEEILQFIGD